MPTHTLFQIDAFASHVFSGNPAAVVPLHSWLDDSTLQAIAAENNLSETAFFVPGGADGTDFDLRWMTPASEVDLCGHATLASAHALWTHLGWDRDRVVFSSRSGPLTVRREGELYEMDFPALPVEPSRADDTLVHALGGRPAEVYTGMDLICVFDNEREIMELNPDFGMLKQIEGVRAVGVTAPGRSHDFVSRLFAPAVGVDEDPVTGSLHCLLAPYWADRLGRSRLVARQVSKRGGEIRCTVDGDRVRLSGRAVTYLEGTITVGDGPR
mgnify:CR=1 FL=1